MASEDRDENTAPSPGRNTTAHLKDCADAHFGDQSNFYGPLQQTNNYIYLNVTPPSEKASGKQKRKRSARKAPEDCGDSPSQPGAAAAVGNSPRKRPDMEPEVSACLTQTGRMLQEVARDSGDSNSQPGAGAPRQPQLTNQTNAFDGKTLREVFGPFTSADELNENPVRHAVNLFGKVILKYSDPNPPEVTKPEREKTGTASKFRQKLKVHLEMELKSGGKFVLPLEALYESATSLKPLFKKEKKHIICGVKIEVAKEQFNSEDSQFVGNLGRMAVVCLSEKANLDTKADEELKNFVPDQLPIVMLSDGQWPTNKFIQGKLISKEWKPESKERLSMVFRDETGTFDVVAFGQRAREWNAKGTLLKDKVYKIFMGNGRLENVPDEFRKTSSPFQLKTGLSTKISRA